MNFPKVILKCAAASLCAITLASCSGQSFLSSAPDLNKQLQLTASVTSGDGSFTAEFVRSSVGQWQVTIIEPYEVQGVSFSYSNGNSSAAFGEFSAETLTDDFAVSPPALIITALENTVQDSAAAVAYQQDTYTVQSGTCLLTFNRGSAAPIALDLPELKAEITDFKITGNIFPDGADVVVVG